jgi:hypothetical protein
MQLTKLHKMENQIFLEIPSDFRLHNFQIQI